MHLVTSKLMNGNKRWVKKKTSCVALSERLPDLLLLKDFGVFCMHPKLLNYFVVSVGAQSFCLLTVILHFGPLIDRATRMYKQKINNAGPPDRPLLLLEVTGLLVAVPVADQKM